MKRKLPILLLPLLFACGPNEAEKEAMEQQRQDSVAVVTEKRMVDSLEIAAKELAPELQQLEEEVDQLMNSK